MKNLLVLILATCVLGAHDNPAAEAPKPAAVEKPAEPKPKIRPVNVRDELIELIHQLKDKAQGSPFFTISSNPENNALFVKKYEVDMKEKTEAKHLLLQALVELAKEVAKDKPSQAWHSSSPSETLIW